MPVTATAEQWCASKRRVTVGPGLSMAYAELGTGPPVVFLHGNPTSSYLWRNIAPAMADRARCLVPDLIGMGDSDKLADSGRGSYRFADHARWLAHFMSDVVGDEPVTLVLHDWGSALGFDWGAGHPDRVRAVAYLEALLRPMSWAEWPQVAHTMFAGLRSDAGEDMVLRRNLFVERLLPSSTLLPMDAAVLAEYVRPFVEPGECRRPTLTWPREIPLGGTPADMVERLSTYGEWLSGGAVPKLFINVEPGFMLTGALREHARTFANQTEVTVPGGHFTQEDSPAEIAGALVEWWETLMSEVR